MKKFARQVETKKLKTKDPVQQKAAEPSPKECYEARMDLARSMLTTNDGWVELVPDPSGLAPEHPFESIQQQRSYEPELRRYFDFHMDYYPHYDRPMTVTSLHDWGSFIDIHDDTVEAKFPIDRDIRAYITAFRLSLQRNYRRFVVRRRRDQLLLLLTLLVPLAAWALVPAWRPETTPDKFMGLAGFVSGEGRTMSIAVASIFVLIFGGLLYNMSQSRKVLASTLHANAGDLKAKVQRRINSLHQGYNHSVKAVNEAELSASSEDDRWVDDAKYWAQIALWKPKRIEHIEKFYQSEMQRLRVGAFRWRVAMRLLGWAMVAITIGAAAALGYVAGDPVGITLAGVVGVLSFLHYRIILSKPYIVELTDIRRFIGENDWKRFSDINFDEDFADIIRRDKVRIRQEKSRGGMLGRAA
ncbi:MAG: hypothetical protein HRU11_08710 [Parvularculaceae bacterium]|nr:hypothetical protein [Parvularculaceae bacterium]